ncbi:MAG: transposase [Planctomycetes bacterium]|nr:transposase [Planctomycetota bacterium]
MAQAIRQSESNPTAGDWLTVDEAAALTGESPRTWQRRAAWEAQQAATRNRQSLALLRRPADGGRPSWYVHRSLDPVLTRFPAPDERTQRALPTLRTRYPDAKVDEARVRFAWLQRWRELCAGKPGVPEELLAERVVGEARAVHGEDYPISYRTLRNWRRLHDAMGPEGQIAGLEALIDKRGLSEVPLGQRGRDQAAIDYFYSVYRSQAKHSIKMAHRCTVHKAEEAGWKWPKSYAATQKWLACHDEIHQTYLDREGPTAYGHKDRPYLDINWETIEPGFWYVLDHTQADFWARGDNGKVFRPWLTVVLDCRSRCVTGWRLGQSANQDAIVAACLMAFTQWAVPSRIRIDRGKDFECELLTGVTKQERLRYRHELGPDWQDKLRRQEESQWLGVFGELGIDLIRSIAYEARSKALVERFFRTFEEQCAKAFASYTGNSPEHRPECSEELRGDADVPSLEESRKWVGEWIDLYHRLPHGGLHGAAPLTVWGQATSLRRARDEHLLTLMQSRGVYRVGPNGVSFRIAGRTLTYGKSCTALYRHTGRDVFITLDPNDASCCFAWTADRGQRRYIGRLECNGRISANTSVEVLREAMREKGRRDKLLRRAAAEAPKRMRTAGQEVAAMQLQELERLRKTGTYDTGNAPNIVPVRTGFEGGAMPVRTANERRPETVEEHSLRDLFLPEEPDEEEDDDDRNLGSYCSKEEDLDDDPEPSSGLRSYCSKEEDLGGDDEGTEDDMADLFSEPLPKMPRNAGAEHDRFWNVKHVAPEDEGDNHGTEADQPQADSLSLIAGNRHAGRTE